MAEAELHGQRFTQHWGGGHERRSGTSEASLGYGEPVWRGWGVSDLSHLRVPAAPPSTLNLGGAHRKRKTLVAPEINISLDQSEGSLLSDDFLDTPDDLDINVDDIETPDETDSLEFLGNGNELEWEGNGGVPALSPSGFSPATSSSAPPPPPATITAPGDGVGPRTHSVWSHRPVICVNSVVTGFSQPSEVQRDPTYGLTRVGVGRGN